MALLHLKTADNTHKDIQQRLEDYSGKLMEYWQGMNFKFWSHLGEFDEFKTNILKFVYEPMSIFNLRSSENIRWRFE